MRILDIFYIKIIKLTDRSIKKNPLCEKCNKSMKSIGKNKGYRCIKCGSKSSKIRKIESNNEIENKLYLPVLSAQRHLIKPADRYGKEQRSKKKLKGNWFKIFG